MEGTEWDETKSNVLCQIWRNPVHNSKMVICKAAVTLTKSNQLVLKSNWLPLVLCPIWIRSFNVFLRHRQTMGKLSLAINRGLCFGACEYSLVNLTYIFLTCLPYSRISVDLSLDRNRFKTSWCTEILKIHQLSKSSSGMFHHTAG